MDFSFKKNVFLYNWKYSLFNELKENISTQLV